MQLEKAGPSKSSPERPHIYSNGAAGAHKKFWKLLLQTWLLDGLWSPRGQAASLQDTRTSVLDPVLLLTWFPSFFTRHNP